jgi:hypothetical protein
LKLPSLLMARRNEPVYFVVSPGSKVGFFISFDLRRFHGNRSCSDGV